MIINTGSRTDVPAFYSRWLLNRIREGFVLVRNPYNPQQVTKYLLDPELVDLIAFCTKNPAPILPHMHELDRFRQFWFVTITAYGRDIEPNVPPAGDVIESFRKLSDHVGVNAVGWRYDPIFIDDKHTLQWHVKAFERMAAELSGYTKQVVISFIDLYEKTKRNFPDVRQVSSEERFVIGEAFARIAENNGMAIRGCAEGTDLDKFGVDSGGCMTKRILEDAIGERLLVPKSEPRARQECECLLGRDIGAYNTCMHDCIYCYANYDKRRVRQNVRFHDSDSPFLIGNSMPGDKIHLARQESFISDQIMMEL